jgi:hypothetical protein
MGAFRERTSFDNSEQSHRVIYSNVDNNQFDIVIAVIAHARTERIKSVHWSGSMRTCANAVVGSVMTATCKRIIRNRCIIDLFIERLDAMTFMASLGAVIDSDKATSWRSRMGIK